MCSDCWLTLLAMKDNPQIQHIYKLFRLASLPSVSQLGSSSLCLDKPTLSVGNRFDVFSLTVVKSLSAVYFIS